MFYRNTRWAERYAASQAAQYMPGTQRRPSTAFLKYGRGDFATGSEFFWFYMRYLILSTGCFLALGIIVLDIGLYVHPPEGRPRPDWKPLVLGLLPSVSILVWMSVDGTHSSPAEAWPRTRLAVEALIDAGSIACVGVLGAMVKRRAEEGDWYAGFYAAMMSLLGVMVLLRLFRLCELVLDLRKRPEDAPSEVERRPAGEV